MQSQLEHPNICQIYDCIDEKACDYLVLELIEGQRLGTAKRSMQTVRQLLPAT